MTRVSDTIVSQCHIVMLIYINQHTLDTFSFPCPLHCRLCLSVLWILIYYITGGLVTGKILSDHTTPSILHITQSSSRSKLKNESAAQNISLLPPTYQEIQQTVYQITSGGNFYILSSSGDWGLNKGNTGFNIHIRYYDRVNYH